MKEESFEITEELRRLKEDYSQLKENLATQKVLNDKLMEATFRRNLRTIMNDKKISVIAGVMAAIIIPVMGYLFSLPFKYMAILESFAIVLTVANVVFYKKFNLDRIDFSDILSGTRMMQKFRKAYLRMVYIGWGVFIVIIISLLPRVISVWSTPAKAACAVVFLILVVSAGILIECHYSRNLIRSCDSIIKRLEDFGE